MSPTDHDHPCGTCLRWWECNGTDADNCPAVLEFNEKKEDDHWKDASEKST